MGLNKMLILLISNSTCRWVYDWGLASEPQNGPGLRVARCLFLQARYRSPLWYLYINSISIHICLLNEIGLFWRVFMKGIILLPRFWKSVSKLETFIFSGNHVGFGWGTPMGLFCPQFWNHNSDLRVFQIHNEKYDTLRNPKDQPTAKCLCLLSSVTVIFKDSQISFRDFPLL